MSWLTDLAGKAEQLLNKVDQSAAVALKKEDEGGPAVIGRSRSYTPPVRNVASYVSGFQMQMPRAPSVSLSSFSPPKLSTTAAAAANRNSTAGVESSPSSTTPPSRPKSRKQIEDEKLFEFLNSPEMPNTGNLTTTTMVDVASTSSISNTIQLDNLQVAIAANVVSPADVTMAEDHYVKMSPPSFPPPQKDDASINNPLIDGTTVTSDQLNEHIEAGSTKSAVEPIDHAPVDQSTTKVGSLELENRLLHSEIASLNRELKQSLQKTHNVEAELRLVQEQLNVCTAQEASEAKSVREYQERESDLRTALEAKDSQLAVLRVRLHEADHELATSRETTERLESDNRRILEDYSNSSGLHGLTIQAAQDRLQQAEELLERERVHFRSLQVESAQRISRLEEMNTLASNFGETKTNLEEERSRSAELAGQLRTARDGLESVQQELTDYKTKAQWILQSKERLIASLKESAAGNATDGTTDSGGKAAAAAFVQLEEIRQERDLLKEELAESGRQLEQTRAEMHHEELQLQSELDASREYSRETDDRLKEEQRRREECEQEAAQLRDEVRYLSEDGSRQKATLQSRLLDRDAEIERLRKQLVIRQVNGGGGAAGNAGGRADEIEAKLAALTENLIHKQTMLETLSTEKNSLVFQLERTEQQLKEQSLHSRRNASTAVSVNDDTDSSFKHRVAGFMAETPFDGQVARKVKRVYNTIDTVSFRLGVFLKRYPMARVLIILYMVLLHFWVMVVLLTYSPEIHDKDCLVPNGKR